MTENKDAIIVSMWLRLPTIISAQVGAYENERGH